jgi:hypothetical protein
MVLAVAPLGIEEQTHITNSLQILPNPNKGDFIIGGNVGNQQNLNFEITDLLGRVLFSKKALTKNGKSAR